LVVVVMVTTFTAVATPHALILTVSHDLLFRQPLSCAAAPVPPFSCRRSPVRIKHQRRTGIHASEPAGRRSHAALVLTSAFTSGSTAVLPTPRYARNYTLQMRARPMNVSV